MSGTLTRPDLLLELLEHGPQRTRQLAEALGFVDCDDSARHAVHRALDGLRRRGYTLYQYNQPGSHHGGVYCLVARPHQAPRDPSRCMACQCNLARDNFGSVLCSPCQRKAMDYEMAGLWGQMTVDEVMVGT